MAKLVPAILELTAAEVYTKIQSLKDFGHTGRVQIDFCDGLFVDNKTVAVEELEDLPTGFEYEAHFMEQQLPAWPSIEDLGFSVVIVHWEVFSSSADVEDVRLQIEAAGLTPVLALNPDSELEEFLPDLEGWPQVLVMSIIPGKQGRPFISDSLHRVAVIRRMYPEVKIEVDGGIRQEHIPSLLESGADFLCVGSGIFAQENPKAAFEELTKLLKTKKT